VRVCLVAPFVSVIDERSPQLGGAQALVADLACGLAAAGHDVALLAARGSFVTGVSVIDLGIDAKDLVPATLLTASARRDDAAQRDAFARARAWVDRERVDVVHAHAYDGPAFDALEGAAPPVVHTLHLPPLDASVVSAARRSSAAMATVSRANAHAWEERGVRIRAVVPNGVDVSRIPFGSGEGGYLLVAGRIAPEKGVDVAARVARAAGMPLWVVGQVYDDAALRTIDPSGVRFLGPRSRADVFSLMAGAKALLMPVRWDEPFGLVAAEAMAAGTPVVGYRRGGLAEVVEDGRTGFLVEPDDEEALARAVGRIGVIDRRVCRDRVEHRFSLQRMVDGYAAFYASVTPQLL